VDRNRGKPDAGENIGVVGLILFAAHDGIRAISGYE
jgi:hypothetical protein